MAETGALLVHGNVGATADTVTLTEPVKSVVVVNKHATQTLYATVMTSTVSGAAALANVVTAVVAADETWYIPPVNGAVEVFRSTRERYVALSLIASGAATTYAVHGRRWY